jgi:phage terminase large subunit-like protein
LTDKEAFFGGAAGGGKSDSLLRDPLQFVHIPKYSALILRTSATDLRLSGGLIPRSHQWIGERAHWNGNDSKWTFPSGATIQFGYLSNTNDKFRYRSSEFQYIAFDELTDFTEEDYLFMFSRVRQTIDIVDPFTGLSVPEKLRAASNPGGKGHDWVRNRFISPELERDLVSGDMKDKYQIVETDHSKELDGRVSVPSKIKDNPAIDARKYVRNLLHLPPVMRERMMNGDWTIMPTGLIKHTWLRYYKMRHEIVELLVSRITNDGDIVHTNEVAFEFHEQEARRIMTVDPAGGVEEIEREFAGKSLSFTAAGVFDYKTYGQNRALLTKEIKRAKGLSYPEMRDLVKGLFYKWRPSHVYVEDKAMGMALVGDLQRELPISAIGTEGKDKVARAAPWTNMLEQGQFYLPQGENSWRPSFESEMLGWQGRKEGNEVNDQIDIAAYAAIVSGGFVGGVVKLDMDPRISSAEYASDSSGQGHLEGGGMMKGFI